MRNSWYLEITDERIKAFFLRTQKTFILRTSWACLLYNLALCCHTVSMIGYDFFSVSNLLLLCVSNGAAIVATIASYRSLRWLHAIAPLLMLTQLATSLFAVFFELGQKAELLLLVSLLVWYCLCQLALVTKWIIQAPLALLISQVGLYLVNRPGQAMGEEVEATESAGATLSVIVLNSFLPLFVLFVSFSLQQMKLNLFLTKMGEAINQIEMRKILKMIPQALFFFDERREEVLDQSDALLSFFGQSVEAIFQAEIFELKEVDESGEDDLDGGTSGTSKQAFKGSSEAASAQGAQASRRMEAESPGNFG